MIRIVEVGPRDGLQNEAAAIPTDVKVAFVNALSQAGLPEIEAGAFVSPKWVPQLADSEDVFRRIARRPGVVYSALVPNLQGYERARACRADKVAVFTAASETFNRRNVNASIEESLERFRPVLAEARRDGVPVRGYISTAFWCPYEGKVKPEKTLEVALRLKDLGVAELSIGDTIGKASPPEVAELLGLLAGRVPVEMLAVHFHDTYGRAVANVLEARRRGVRTFDASTGGLGGCPYAPGASGNVATEAVVRALRAAGDEVGVDLEALARARAVIAPAVGRALAE
ncbi:MAG TPA: hydroxymethylglutaryl-CoA lyase [Planctomycetota bacterium]|nr:hydroxymethylglutaryl-CoA lyase [Planctomycetota bacterium]